MQLQDYFYSLISEWRTILFASTIVCIYLIYRSIKNKYDYFSKRNVPYIKPVLLFGNMTPVFFRKRSVLEHIDVMYKELDGHRIGGFFQFMEPLHMIRDPELVKRITIKDFDHFMDLAVFISADIEPILSKSLQALTGQDWRNMRNTLSPAFTSSKMKIMFVLVSEIGEQIIAYLKDELKKQQSSTEKRKISDPPDVLLVDLKEVFSKYTNDVIATTAFGVKCNTLEDPNNEFYKMGKEFMKFSFAGIVKFLGFLICPRLMKRVGFNLMDIKMINFFRTLVSDAIRIREKEGIIRPDMIHLLMKVRDEDIFEDSKTDATVSDSTTSITTDASNVKKLSLGIDDIVAQALVFFTAGFEVVSTLLSFSGMMLAVHQDIQKQLRDEIDRVLEEHQGQVTYEAVHSMKLLDNVISETLRLYPPAPMTSRKCVKDYPVPDSDYVIKKDSMISIPVVAFHHDPKYFPNPEEFNPDRFSEENKHNIQPFTFMPFGSGPRQCIANRFALMESKVALVHLLKNFEIHVTSKTKQPVQLVKNFMLAVEGGFWVGLKLRTDKS